MDEKKEEIEKEILLDIEAEKDIDAHNLGEKLETFLYDVLGITKGPVYIKKVGQHIEIGQAKIECIP